MFNEAEDMSSEKSEEREDVRQLVARVSYESGVHWIRDASAAHEALRRRHNTLLPAVLVVVALVVALLPDTGSAGPSILGKVGVALVLTGFSIVGAASVYVSWPVEAVYGFSPINTWDEYSQHQDVTKAYREMGKDLEEHCRNLEQLFKPRNRAHKVALVATVLVMVGLGMEVIDVAY